MTRAVAHLQRGLGHRQQRARLGEIPRRHTVTFGLPWALCFCRI